MLHLTSLFCDPSEVSGVLQVLDRGQTGGGRVPSPAGLGGGGQVVVRRAVHLRRQAVKETTHQH